ncbi:MAG: hypothetical protein U9Q73_01520 [Nanoarchaeota archaeon]|nr:hypothetical protein [Nanoarchaeota archaeon]
MANNRTIQFYAINDSEEHILPGAASLIERMKDINYPCVVLIRQNNWNDHTYFSHFYTYYKKEKNYTPYLIGPIRIIQSGAIGNKTELPREFEKLDNSKFFSRGFSQFIKGVTGLGDLKKFILESLNEVDFCQHTKNKILKIDATLLEPYENSLFRYDYYDLDTSSEYAQNSMNMLKRIENCEENIKEIDKKNKDFIINLLYGSAVATLESYLGDAFKYNVIKEKHFFCSFLKNYKFPRGDTKYSLKDLGLHGNKIGEYIEEEAKKIMNDIIFHKLEVVKGLYETILSITLPDMLMDFQDAVSKRHDIFHRNGKTKSGVDLNIQPPELSELIKNIRVFIGRVESIFDAQK